MIMRMTMLFDMIQLMISGHVTHLFDVEGYAGDGAGPCSVLTEGPCTLHLRPLLEAAHPLLPSKAGSPYDDQGPATHTSKYHPLFQASLK